MVWEKTLLPKMSKLIFVMQISPTSNPGFAWIESPTGPMLSNRFFLPYIFTRKNLCNGTNTTDDPVNRIEYPVPATIIGGQVQQEISNVQGNNCMLSLIISKAAKPRYLQYLVLFEVLYLWWKDDILAIKTILISEQCLFHFKRNTIMAACISL